MVGRWFIKLLKWSLFWGHSFIFGWVIIHPIQEFHQFWSKLIGEPNPRFPVLNPYPNAPCMEYLPTFPLECGHFEPNVGKYSLHGASGLSNCSFAHHFVVGNGHFLLICGKSHLAPTQLVFLREVKMHWRHSCFDHSRPHGDLLNLPLQLPSWWFVSTQLIY